MIINLNKNYKPLDFQIDILKGFHQHNRALITIARQCGKTWLMRRLVESFIFSYKEVKNPTCIVLARSVDQTIATFLTPLLEGEDSTSASGLGCLPKSICWTTGNAASGRKNLYFRRPDGSIARVVFLGTQSNTRGLTCNLLLADEIAFYPPDLLLTVYFPMLDRTGGKFLGSSTVNGENHYYTMTEAYKELQRQGNKRYFEYNRTIKTANVYSDEFIDNKAAEYKAAGKYHVFLQEYMNDFQAASGDESPFSRKVWDARNAGRVTYLKTDDLLNTAGHINVSCDIGKPKNTRCWEWVYIGGKAYILGYTDQIESLHDIPGYYAHKYKQCRSINIFFPEDINQPSLELGGTRYDNIVKVMRNMGWDRRVRLQVLPRTKNKVSLMSIGIDFLDKCIFNARDTTEGLKRLSGSRFQKDRATGEVKFGKFVDNGHQHTADAFCYIPAVIDDNLIPPNAIFNRNAANVSGWGQKY